MENQYIYQLGALVLLVLAAVFLFILPENKKKKALAQELRELAPGDFVYTGNGLRGQVESVDGEIVTVTCRPDGTRLEIARWGVVRIECRRQKA